MKLEPSVEAVDARASPVTLKERAPLHDDLRGRREFRQFESDSVGDEVHDVVIEEFAVAGVSGGSPRDG
jgi:hypothetical protein